MDVAREHAAALRNAALSPRRRRASRHGRPEDYEDRRKPVLVTLWPASRLRPHRGSV